MTWSSLLAMGLVFLSVWITASIALTPFSYYRGRRIDRARMETIKASAVRDCYDDPRIVQKKVAEINAGPSPDPKPFDPLDPNVDKSWCVSCDGIKASSGFGLTRDQLHWMCADCRIGYDDPDAVLNPRPVVVEQSKSIEESMREKLRDAPVGGDGIVATRGQVPSDWPHDSLAYLKTQEKPHLALVKPPPDQVGDQVITWDGDKAVVTGSGASGVAAHLQAFQAYVETQQQKIQAAVVDMAVQRAKIELNQRIIDDLDKERHG